MPVLRARRERGARTAEFEAFVAGAAGRLLHAATLLTAEAPDRHPDARRLLTTALARTYADWDRLRGEDPYDRTRQELARLFAHRAWRYRRGKRPGVLAQLSPQERLVVVVRLHFGVPEEQAAAQLGLPEQRVHALCARSVDTLLAP